MSTDTPANSAADLPLPERTLSERISAAFEPISSRPELRESAQKNLLRWIQGKEFAPYHPQLKRLLDGGRWELLFDSFYQVLPFGTGGRRGPVGVGTNRFNPWTLSASVQGHVAWLKEKIGPRKEPLHVVIAYDVRAYQDSNNIYDRAVPNPSLGLSSRDFAEIAAGVYAANGVTVTLLPPESDTFVSTPELSFAIRHLKADGGLNVSASHNPPDDNGGKFYNALGGQEVPPDDERMATLVDQVEQIVSIPYKQARTKGLVKDYPASVHEAYIAVNVATSLAPGFRGARIVFTGLHGTGDTTVVEVLKAAGFVVAVEPTQAPHDGAFPEVPFRTPNPEVRQSMERAVDLADRLAYELVMACDPDADRIGLFARCANGKYRFFTGNEIGALVTEWRLRARGGNGGIVMKTEVTTELITRVAKAAGATVVGDLLVGFKYIGDGLRLLEEKGQFQNATGTVADFVVGVEESHGVLVTPALRDKDAAGAALALAEFASSLLPDGRTLADALGALWVKHGYVHNELMSTVMRGAAGRARIEAIQASMRESPPGIIGDFEVTDFHDRLDPEGPLGPIVSGTDAASRDVLVFQLGRDRRIILRPSGTEPKNKVYVECAGKRGAALTAEIPRVAEEAKELALAFVEEMLSRVGISLPNWALRVSDLVAIEQKIHFATTFIPQLQAKIAAGEEVDSWIDATLKPYGKDPRGLVTDAMRAWAATVTDGTAAMNAVLSKRSPANGSSGRQATLS